MKEAVPRTFVAAVEDRPGVLNRVVSLVRRRGFNIDSLTVGRTERPDVSRITLTMRADPDTARRVQASLYKLVDVLSVEDVTFSPAVVHELALVKVRAPAEQRLHILRACETFHARAVDLSPATLVVEIAGPSARVDALLETLRPFGILELVRSGAVAMVRGTEAQVASDRAEAVA
jgi:acetolactate synthase I/III small subunit